MVEVVLTGLSRGEHLSVVSGAGSVRLKVAGHAGVSAQGSDIVCAGVSSLVQASLRMIVSYGIAIEMRSTDGIDSEIRVDCLGQEELKTVLHSLETAVCGIEKIAQSYPDNCLITFETKGLEHGT